jgi:hypothetical protein
MADLLDALDADNPRVVAAPERTAAQRLPCLAARARFCLNL